MNDERDLELGDAIESLPVPPRPDGFITDVLASIASQEPAAKDSPAAHRRWFERRRLRRLLVAAAAAAVLITVGTLFGISRQPNNTLRFDPDPATAREVIESTLAVTGAAESIQGTMIGGEVEHGEFRELERLTFAVDDEGDMARRLVSQAAPTATPSPGAVPHIDPGPILEFDIPMLRSDIVYDAVARRSRNVTMGAVSADTQVDAADLPAGWEIHGQPLQPVPGQGYSSMTTAGEGADHAAGAPYRESVDDLLPWLRLRAYMRLLLAGESPDMREVTVDGREAWELTTMQRSSGQYEDGLPPSQPVTIAIDRETRLPLRYRWKTGAGRWYEVRFTDYRLDDDVDGKVFELPFPDDALVMRSPESLAFPGPRQWAMVDFDDATLMRDKIGATPGLPAWRPQGFSLASATWCAFDAAGNPQSLLNGSPAATLSLAYRRGLDAFYVSAEPTDRGRQTIGLDQAVDGRRNWSVDTSDPFGIAWGPSLRYIRQHTQEVRLHGGAFDGHVAHLVLDPSVLPHIWVQNARYTATVSGDLSQEEMIQVAESLGSPWMEK